MNKIIESMNGRFIDFSVRHFHQLKAAYSISMELLSALDLEDSLKILVNRIASYMSVEIVSIMLIDSDKRRLIVKIARGLDDEVIRDAGTQIGEGISGWVGKTGEPLLIKDLTKDVRFLARSGGKYYNNSLLSVPLKMRHRVIGVINVNNKMSRDIFKERDLDLLKTIADLAVIALEAIRLEEQVAKSSKDNREFISNVTHDLKTPLATIREALSLILESVNGPVNEKQKRYLSISIENVDRMVRMINEILLSDRILQSPHSIKRNLFNVTQTARTILDSLEIIAKEKNIVLEGIIPDKKIDIWGDPDKLSEVISNLVDNAIKYNKPKGRVGVSLEDDEKAVTISIQDTGIGISKEDINKIFDRYYRMSGAKRIGIPGTGLGLAIVKDIVNMHKGNISVESEQNKGTKFILTLPKDLRT